MVPHSLIVIPLMLISLLLQASLGYWVTESLRKISNQTLNTEFLPFNSSRIPVLFVVGLLLQLYVIWLFKSLGLGWAPTFVFVGVLGLPGIRGVLKLLMQLSYIPSVSFTLWTIATILLGLSIFTPGTSITTPWVNNYGDLTIHLGMIISFVHDSTFPLEYHLFAGEPLSYPFLVNLWSASILWISPNFNSLAYIFQMQWLIAWCLAYFFLRGDKYPLIPWAVLLGGGSYELLLLILYAEPSSVYYEAQTHQFLESGFPWTQFPASLWIPQRTLLLGLPCILASLHLFHQWYCKAQDSNKDLATPPAGALAVAALSVLAHTHFCIIVLAYELLAWVWLWKVELWKDNLPESESLTLAQFNSSLFAIVLALTPVFGALPLLSAKGQVLGYMPGWFANSFDAAWATNWQIPNVIALWLSGAWPWFLLLGSISFCRCSRRLLALITLLFIAANFIELAIWEWDQIKVFLALYIISLQSLASQKAIPPMTELVILPLLIIPGLFDTVRNFVDYQNYTVYSQEDLSIAERIKTHTPRTAIILGAPTHNSPATLSGRRLFYGYEGTLHSHGLPYHERQTCMQNLETAIRCKLCSDSTRNSCSKGPDYLLWTAQEKSHWKNSDPDTLAELTKVAGTQLYEIELHEELKAK